MVETLKAEGFFKMLYEADIIAQNQVNLNLCQFLCIDKSFKNILMLKKIKRAVVDFQSSQALQIVGFKKNKATISAMAHYQRKITDRIKVAEEQALDESANNTHTRHYNAADLLREEEEKSDNSTVHAHA